MDACVANKYGYKGDKDHSVVDRLVRNNLIGRWTLNNLDATGPNGILKTYGLVHTPDEPYSKAIKQSGIVVHYIPSEESPQ